jgi:hypothetical protein
MGHVILKQTKTDLVFVSDEGEELPIVEGQYAVWSTVVDDFIYANGTKEEIIEFFAEAAAERAREETKRVLEFMEKGRSFTRKTFDGCLETAQRHHENKGSIRTPKAKT